MEHTPPTQLGPYRLLHLLGRGGMGQVFAAVHEQMGQQVALKILSPSFTEDPQAVARFLQEARALAQLQHPGVVRIFHCDRLEGTVFLAMERLQGLSLREWMQCQDGPVPPHVALKLGAQIAAIMVDVHAQGIVHRDLKPENVFLCPQEGASLDHRVKLLDFGIAKLPPAADEVLANTQVHTHESSLLGTYAYMAPEQLRSAASVNDRADVYALGVLLFELLASRTPFVADDPVDMLTAHMHEEPPPLKQWVPSLPPALSVFINSMLAKDPAQRPDMRACRDKLGGSWEHTGEECPVPGLTPFTEAHAELFFGRTAETRALLSLLGEARDGTRRWVQLEGLSGVGKSSLIQAGLLPTLRQPPEPETSRWLVAHLRPSDEPLRALAQALTTAYAHQGINESPEELEHLLSERPEALSALVISRTPVGSLLLLVIDPLEELFTLGMSEIRHLDALLSSALAAPACPLRLLTSVRSDFLHRLEQMPSLAHHLPGAARYPLLPMAEEALTQVIQGVARHAGLRLGEGVASRMVADTRGEGGRLPLLGYALRELWTLSKGAPLTQEDYERMGGVGGALARQAEALLDSLDAEGRERAKWLLLELVQVGRGVPDTRRPRARKEVLTAAGGDQRAEEVLLRLTGMRTGGTGEREPGPRLVMLSEGEEPSHQRAELVHATLLHKVPSLAHWIEQERALLERHADLEVAAHAWEQARYPTEGLPTGTLLTHYRGGPGVARGGNPLEQRVSPRAAGFLLAAKRLERRRAWTRRMLMAGALVAGLLIVFYAARAEQERQHAERNLRQLIETVDDFVRGSDWRLSRFPGTLDVRRKMLQDFRSALESLPPQERQQPKASLTLIRVCQRQADLAFHDDTLAKADGLLLEALAKLDIDLAQRPGDRELREEMALNHSKRGKVALARGLGSEAREHFVEAVTRLEGLGVQPGEDEEDYWRTLAVSLSELAEAEFALGNRTAASALYERALSLHARNHDAYSQYLLALTWGDRMAVARDLNDQGAEKRYLREALESARASVESEPGNHLFQWVLARTLVKGGALQPAYYQEAIELAKKVHQGEPFNKRYALVLAQALQGEESLLRAQGKQDEAERLRVERCDLIDQFHDRDPEDIHFQSPDCKGGEGIGE